jgi:sugar-specific transcriptional regulator TrmB
MKISKRLCQNLGLTPDQAQVYIAGLEMPQASVQDLSRLSGVKRTTIYSFIDELIENGFIVRKKKNKRYLYSSVHPRQLLELEKSRVKELAETTIPELEALFNEKKHKPSVLYFEGVSGIQEVYADMLKERKPILELEDLEAIKDVLPKSFFEYFPAERARRNITLKTISRDSKAGREFAKKNNPLLRETKFVEAAQWKTDINIYGNKVAIMSFRSAIPYCVLIEDENIAETLRTAWEMMWAKE